MTHSERGRHVVVAAAVLFTVGTGLVSAAPVTAPAGLNPGDQYRLVFVTAGTHNASSSNISDYDAFVATEANSSAELSALGTTWVAIGSTDTVNASDHIGGSFAIPIYNLAGSLVATGSSDLWDGTIAAPIQYDQNGTSRTTQAWSGTGSNGQKSSNPLGTSSSVVATYGSSTQTNFAWIFNGQIGQTTPLQFYAISATLTVPPSAVPEPGTLVPVGLALALARLVSSRLHSRLS